MPEWQRTDFHGFPPGRDYVLLPRAPAGAAEAGLVLYDPSLLHQRVAIRAGRVLLRLGLGRMLPVRSMPALPDPDWWAAWLAAVVEPQVGPVTAAAFRAGHARSGNPPRTTALLIDRHGRPLAFAKLSPEPALGREALRLLAESHPGAFRVPALLAAGSFEGAEYLLQAPMPAGHAGPGRRPDLLAAVVDDLQRRLQALPRPAGLPAGHVPVHTAVSPGNLRVDGAGDAWLIDWDKAQWGPPLTDELRYWLAYYAPRRGTVARRARRVVELTAARGDRAQVERALAWRIGFRPAEPDRPQQRMRDAVAALLS